MPTSTGLVSGAAADVHAGFDDVVSVVLTTIASGRQDWIFLQHGAIRGNTTHMQMRWCIVGLVLNMIAVNG